MICPSDAIADYRAMLSSITGTALKRALVQKLEDDVLGKFTLAVPVLSSDGEARMGNSTATNADTNVAP